MKKNIIVYGDFSGVEKRAVEVLSETIMDYTGVFPDCVSSENVGISNDFRYFFVGTKENNPYVHKYVSNKLSYDEQYIIKITDGNVVICGNDARGVLCGCIDFYSKFILSYEYKKMVDCCTVNVFESKFEDFECTSHPSVKNRGIWTWGHVI